MQGPLRVDSGNVLGHACLGGGWLFIPGPAQMRLSAR